VGDRGDEMNRIMRGAGDGEMIGGREVEEIWVAGREREGSGMIRKRNAGIRMQDSNAGVKRRFRLKATNHNPDSHNSQETNKFSPVY
jgi:hypothetical protein